MNRTVRASLLLMSAVAIPGAAHALTVDVAGKELATEHRGEVCLDLTGKYPGFIIKSAVVGKQPRICLGARRRNKLLFEYISIVATEPPPPPPAAEGEQGKAVAPAPAPFPMKRTIRVANEFSSGPKGLVYARTQVRGFFTTAIGTKPPAGTHVSVQGYFSQAGNDDPIGDVIEQEVEETMQSALLNSIARDEYLVSGRRTLKCTITFTLGAPGESLVIQKGTAVVLDTVKDFNEKLEGWGGSY